MKCIDETEFIMRKITITVNNVESTESEKI